MYIKDIVLPIYVKILNISILINNQGKTLS